MTIPEIQNNYTTTVQRVYSEMSQGLKTPEQAQEEKRVLWRKFLVDKFLITHDWHDLSEYYEPLRQKFLFLEKDFRDGVITLTQFGMQLKEAWLSFCSEMGVKGLGKSILPERLDTYYFPVFRQIQDDFKKKRITYQVACDRSDVLFYEALQEFFS